MDGSTGKSGQAGKRLSFQTVLEDIGSSEVKVHLWSPYGVGQTIYIFTL